mmetsp:Transcript_16633/g.25144  ORF Transcript_16633/g.25144 Transcript_16633/m.25144 type:complete len:83 (-) Transcript_16633:284-532(-)
MSTWDAVVLSGKVLRPVTVLVIDLVRVDTAAVVWVEREEKKSVLLFPLDGGDATFFDLLSLLLVPFKRELVIIPPMRLHAPE